MAIKRPDYKKLQKEREAYWQLTPAQRYEKDMARWQSQYDDARSRNDYATMRNLYQLHQPRKADYGL